MHETRSQKRRRGLHSSLANGKVSGRDLMLIKKIKHKTTNDNGQQIYKEAYIITMENTFNNSAMKTCEVHGFENNPK